MSQAIPFGIVLLGAVPGLLLLFCILIRMPPILVGLGGAVCMTMPETRVFGVVFIVLAVTRYFWVRAHPAPTGKAREEYLREEGEAKSKIYEEAKEQIEEARLLDEKLEEEWVARSRRVKPRAEVDAENLVALKRKVKDLFGKS